MTDNPPHLISRILLDTQYTVKVGEDFTLDKSITPLSRIVCAAIRAEDGELLLGLRHYSPDMLKQLEMRSDHVKFEHRSDCDQGFVDQYGNFWSRKQAWRIAVANNQIILRVGNDDDGTLFSENLY